MCWGNHSPSSHDIAITTEHLGKTADNDISVREDIDIEEVPNGFVDDHVEVIFVSKTPDALEIGGSQKRVSREFREES